MRRKEINQNGNVLTLFFTEILFSPTRISNIFHDTFFSLFEIVSDNLKKNSVKQLRNNMDDILFFLSRFEPDKLAHEIARGRRRRGRR